MNHIHQITLRCLLIIAGFCITNAAIGQAIIRFEQTRTAVNDGAFRDYFSRYKLGSIDPQQIVSLLRSQSQFDTMKVIVEDEAFTFSLEARDIRAEGFVLLVDNGNGPEPQPSTPNVTYYGSTLEGNLPVAITADDDFFTAMISTPEGSIFIESARKIDPGAAANDFVIYNEHNLIKEFKNAMCGTDGSGKETPKSPEQGDTRNSMPCIEFEVAIANDYLMYQKCGSDVGNVLLHNLAILNFVNTKYDDEFTTQYSLKAKVIYVHTSPDNSPWYTGSDYELLLDSFTEWAPDGFGTTHDIGSLWTNRNLDAGVIGYAWIDAMCENAYNINRSFIDNYALLRNLQAHEIGHNFGCVHDAEPGFIMSSSVSSTENWSAISIATMNQAFQGLECFGPCLTNYTNGRVGIGTSSPHLSAILELKSIDKGLLMPRLTMLQRSYIHQPAEGLMVFDTDTKSFWFVKNGSWTELTDHSTVQSNYDNSTALGLSGNVGIGVTFPKNKLDVATEERINPTYDPTNLPLYVTGGNIGTTIAEFRNKWGQSGVAITDQGISAVGWVNNNNLSLSAQATSGSLIFNTNSVERMRIMGSGNIGIGTSTANAPLQFANTVTNRKLVLYDGYNNDHQYYGFGINPATLRYQTDGPWGNHVFYAAIDATSSLELFRITGEGKIGVRNSNPANQMDIVHGTARTGTHALNRPFYVTGDQTDADFGPEIRSSDGQQGIGFGKNTIYATGSNADQDLGLAARGTAGNLIFSTNGSERARFEGDGSLAIGSNAADENAIVDISSTSKGILIPRMSTSQRNQIASPQNGLLVFDNTTNSFWYRVTGTWVELSDNLDAEVFRNGPDKIYMALTDSVGIGTDNPKTKLEVTTSVNQYGITHSGGNVQLSTWIGTGGEIGTISNHPFSLFANNGLNQFIMQPNGNIGMGVPAATHKVDIGTQLRTGTHASDGRPLYVTGAIEDASNGVEIRHTDGTQGIGIGRNTIYAAGSSVDQNIGLAGKGSGGNVLFQTNGAERMRIAGSGRIGVNISNPQNQLDVAGLTGRTGVHPGGKSLYVTEYGGIGSNIAEFRNQSATCGVGIHQLGISAVGTGSIDLNIASLAMGKIIFKTNFTERMSIDGNGSIHVLNTPRVMYFMEDGAANRMVLSHSPSYPTWGLQYIGTTNEFRFLGDSISAMSVELASGNVSIKGTIQTESFISPVLQNNFSNFGTGYASAGYMKDKMGFVHLRGMVSNTGNPSGLVVFTLPPGYRPSSSGILVFNTISNNTLGRVDVLPNGNVVVNLGTAIWTSLDGIIFKAEQ